MQKISVKPLKLERGCYYVMKFQPEAISPHTLLRFLEETHQQGIYIFALPVKDINKVQFEKEILIKKEA